MVKRICHFTSVHSATDGRIFEKECCSLAKAGYEVYFVAPNAKTEIKEWIQQNGQTIRDNQKAILYFKPDDLSRSLIKDNVIIFKPKLIPIVNSKNPESFIMHLI